MYAPPTYTPSEAESQPPPYSDEFGYNGASNSSVPATSEERMKKFQHLVNLYEISREFATRLRTLESCEIVFIVDDSGSMNTPLGDPSGPYDRNPTRWDELRRTVSIVVDLASVFDPNGIDIFFLNRPPMRSVKNSSELIPVFSIPPQGPTPILRILRRVLQEKAVQTQERKLLILIATDGVPTNDAGQQDTKSLEHALRHERNPINRIPVTIIACTDDHGCVGYLNRWDQRIPNLDVADDYKSERTEIHKVQGRSFPFSFGDYVVKILMGPLDKWFDKLDEYPVPRSHPTTTRKNKGNKTSCSIS